MNIDNTLAPWLGKTMKMIENHIQGVFHEMNINLTKTQWLFLKRLQEKEGVPQQELASLCGCDKTSLTRLIHTMEKKNLVERIRSKADKRINNIYLTKKGEDLLEQTKPIMEKFAMSLQDNISEEQIAKTINVIKKVQENLFQNQLKVVETAKK